MVSFFTSFAKSEYRHYIELANMPVRCNGKKLNVMELKYNLDSFFLLLQNTKLFKHIYIITD
jgi:hypothetical protein